MSAETIKTPAFDPQLLAQLLADRKMMFPFRPSSSPRFANRSAKACTNIAAATQVRRSTRTGFLYYWHLSMRMNRP